MKKSLGIIALLVGGRAGATAIRGRLHNHVHRLKRDHYRWNRIVYTPA